MNKAELIIWSLFGMGIALCGIALAQDAWAAVNHKFRKRYVSTMAYLRTVKGGHTTHPHS
jgi:hypothetical protein